MCVAPEVRLRRERSQEQGEAITERPGDGYGPAKVWDRKAIRHVAREDQNVECPAPVGVGWVCSPGPGLVVRGSGNGIKGDKKNIVGEDRLRHGN